MRSDHIFISYAKEDARVAEAVNDQLRVRGISTWIDVQSIRGGQNWQQAISDAIASSRYFLLLMSNHSVSKVGYCQKEIRLALKALELYPYDKVFLIPVRLDPCDVKEPALKELHYIDLFPSFLDGIERICEAIAFDRSALEESGKRVIDKISRSETGHLSTQQIIQKLVSSRNKHDLSPRELELYSELLEIANSTLTKDLFYHKRL